MVSARNGKFVRAKSKWVHPYKKEHPADKLKIKSIISERITGSRIVGLEAKIEAGQVHQMHTHRNEYVIVYCVKGKCVVTVGRTSKVATPKTLIFIPPRVPHRFHNKFPKPWYGIAFAIGTNSKIRNEWLEG